ncbi:MAG: efflux transporter periplasmic adaptor subunit [Candidatus Marinimicrobia bacterium]|nr:efflux transporter periplasmic adaptor subunit [Candidatus Neomarinimicrobiota bacterium]
MNNELKKWGSLTLVLLLAIGIGYRVTKSFASPSESHVDSMAMTTAYTCAMHPTIQKNAPGTCPLCAMDLIPVENEMSFSESDKKSERKIKYWQAPMDPTYKRDTPGKSPMGMDLVPVYEEGDQDQPLQTLRLSPRAEKLAEVEVSPVTRSFATETLRLSGKIVVDETRLETISAWFPGRIEQLFIDYTGITVEKNTHMAKIYSPELLVAQKELLEAVRSGSSRLITSSREKLRLWGLSASQIKQIEKTGRVSDALTLRTSIGGTVLKKHVNEGEYVKTGSKIYDVANLDRLWFVADVYEPDISKLFYGQKAQFVTEAYPGEQFNIVITFIDPVVNPRSRTVRVRGIVDNKHRRLKPDMLAKATINVNYSTSGPVQDRAIQDLYVSPMHPEEYSEKPGKCPICQMPLKKASELGLAKPVSSQKPLLIPSSAPLITGKRAIVYVKVSDRPGMYEGRVVHLGARVGDFYIVKHGLQEGEYVVTKGNFKIDSAMQIQAKPSMMQPKGGSGHAASEHNH